MSVNPNPDISIIESSFRENLTNDYILSIQASLDGFSFSVYDILEKQHLALESYSILPQATPDDFPLKINEIVKKHPYLNNNFKSCCFFPENKIMTIIPAPLYKENKKQEYFDFSFGKEGNYDLLTDYIENLDIYVISGIPHKINESIENVFHPSKTLSFSGLLLENLYANYKNSNNPHNVFLYIRKSSFDLIYFKEKQLNFYNIFHFFTKEDLAYFVVFTLEQLKLNPETVHLTLMGELSQDSISYKTLYKYIRYISFASREDAEQYQSAFHKLPSHYFYNLLNGHKCAL